MRQLFGYDRFEQVQLVDLMNEVYAHEWSALQNHFCPTLKLKEKSRMGARYRKTYHTPQTPYQRILPVHTLLTLQKSVSPNGITPLTPLT